ncbi:hypothetical protein AVEN_160527-1 [Araneus ventricosus]|uniref:Uncharacterized protein n=1 Tax=Araneus ventricosus TaxID=182803 RepID=A0A4Y2PE63_ARAVE|nr:hypothetical protein AVEN_160527-1 [Araneus ventricosus]
MANQHPDYVAHMEWMWHDEEWIPKRIVFAATYNVVHSEPFSVSPTPESLNKFSFNDVLKNLNVNPLDGFPKEDEDDQKIYQAPLEDLKNYLADESYESVLKNAENGWDVTIGTYDFPTFMYFESILSDKVVYLGQKWSAEKTAMEQAQSLYISSRV